MTGDFPYYIWIRFVTRSNSDLMIPRLSKENNDTHVSVPLQLLLLRWLTDAGVCKCDWSRESVTVYGSLNLPLSWSLLFGFRLKSNSLAPRFTYAPWSESRDELKYLCGTEYTCKPCFSICQPLINRHRNWERFKNAIKRRRETRITIENERVTRRNEIYCSLVERSFAGRHRGKRGSSLGPPIPAHFKRFVVDYLEIARYIAVKELQFEHSKIIILDRNIFETL